MLETYLLRVTVIAAPVWGLLSFHLYSTQHFGENCKLLAFNLKTKVLGEAIPKKWFADTRRSSTATRGVEESEEVLNVV